MKPILVPYDENMTKEELLKAIADAVGSDVETVKKELCEPRKGRPSCDTCRLKGTTKWCSNQLACRAYKPKDEPQKDCKKCKNYDRCKNNRWKCCVYEPKTEHTERSE